MSDQSGTVALSLQQILLGIADSLNDAQAALQNVQPYDQYGRPNITYQLPYLDFKLQVESSFEQVEEKTEGGLQKSAASRSRYRQEAMFFKPAKINSTTEKKAEILSTISGRFVANIPNEGLPQVYLTLEIEKGPVTATHRQYGLTVLLGNSAGERLTERLIELNFDEVASESINNGVAVSVPTLDRAEAKTNAEGKVSFQISLPINDYNNARTFVFVVNAGPVAKEFSLSNAL